MDIMLDDCSQFYMRTLWAKYIIRWGCVLEVAAIV